MLQSFIKIDWNKHILAGQGPGDPVSCTSNLILTLCKLGLRELKETVSTNWNIYTRMEYIQIAINGNHQGRALFLRSFSFWYHRVENFIGFPVMYNMMGFQQTVLALLKLTSRSSEQFGRTFLKKKTRKKAAWNGHKSVKNGQNHLKFGPKVCLYGFYKILKYFWKIQKNAKILTKKRTNFSNFASFFRKKLSQKLYQGLGKCSIWTKIW